MARYSDEDKAAALAALEANGGDVRHTARQLGVPRGTLRRWVGAVDPDVEAVLPQKKAALADDLEDVARRLTASLTGKIGEASLQQTATALGIVIDKMALLRGGGSGGAGGGAGAQVHLYIPINGRDDEAVGGAMALPEVMQ